jgi:hypothetical protein
MRFAVFFLAAVTAFAADGYGPLITDGTLPHFIGDKQHWRFSGDILTGELAEPGPEGSFVLGTERFGNFYLRFSARCVSGSCRILFRGTIQPPQQVVGYQVDIGSSGGSLSFRKPGRFSITTMKAEPQEEVSLVRANSAAVNGWSEYEISALDNRITVKVNGKEAVAAIENHGFREGVIGFGLGSGTPAKVEFRDLRIKLLGDFERIDSAAWMRETQELLAMAKSPDEFRPLFDGTSLNGWQDNTAFWSVRNGLITGQPHNSFLVTAHDYANFVLKASVRLTPDDGNSGIQIRSQVIPQGMRGYQVDIGDPWWGHLYVESTQRGILVPVGDRQKRRELVRSNDWNNFVIVCRNSHILSLLNGEVTADLVDYYGEKTGRIGLQIHVGPPMKVDFRDLLIKVLP